ncbi:uncharacterized protein EDB93DRAFT_1253499 [Suillus bovinus]|uniref:uncharacterized protein n=1 Tax=Suillus bovinus TaxID=48563 RepID=UPI001B85B51D|nr:uncharacterized protein EDB93DRAFT_1253499 [Suillus bovinus]KAG2137842.1 hypothetical protein EDB93DRAFT_1253499 [Suillus bovinus]
MSKAPPCRTVPGLLFFTPTALFAAGRFFPSSFIYQPHPYDRTLVLDHRRPTSILFSPSHIPSLSKYGYRTTKEQSALTPFSSTTREQPGGPPSSSLGRNKSHFIFWNVQPFPAHKMTSPHTSDDLRPLLSSPPSGHPNISYGTPILHNVSYSPRGLNHTTLQAPPIRKSFLPNNRPLGNSLPKAVFD